MKFLMVLFALQMLFRPVLPVISYVVNYEYIRSELCENKEKPEMECNGKCHLKKEISKEAEDKDPVSSPKKTTHMPAELLFCVAVIQFDFTDYSIGSEEKNLPDYSNFYDREYTSSIFHPPAILS